MKPKSSDLPEMLSQLEQRLPKVVAAIKHLHRVTGKVCVSDINPLAEKRWSDRCWEAYNVVVEVRAMLIYGMPWSRIETDTMREMFKGCECSFSVACDPVPQPTKANKERFAGVWPVDKSSR